MSTGYMRDKLHRNQMIMPWVEGDTISSVDAASMMQCSSDTVRNLLEEGKLKGYQISPHKPKSPWRVYRKSVENYVARVMHHYDLDTPQPQSAGSTGAAGAAPRRDAKGK